MIAVSGAILPANLIGLDPIRDSPLTAQALHLRHSFLFHTKEQGKKVRRQSEPEEQVDFGAPGLACQDQSVSTYNRGRRNEPVFNKRATGNAGMAHSQR